MRKGYYAEVLFVVCLATILVAQDNYVSEHEEPLTTTSKCPECPSEYFPNQCHEPMLFGTPCECLTCLTLCSIRDPVCPKGEECATKPVYYGDNFVGDTAYCRNFTECLQVECPDDCPESGYLYDLNGCQTCLCADPCAELKCGNAECRIYMSNPGHEPLYSCDLTDLLTQTNECPECPAEYLPDECHEPMFYKSKDCICWTCLTLCSIRYPVCPEGKECATKQVYYGEELVGDTAYCRDFTECPQVECPDDCPESGYLYDLNGCQTCLCADPCAELKCGDVECVASLTSPGKEATFTCDDESRK